MKFSCTQSREANCEAAMKQETAVQTPLLSFSVSTAVGYQ